MYFNNAEWLLSRLYPSLTWSKKGEGKTLYLTFDDGPIPEITEWVLDILKQYDAMGTFFCVGDNVQNNPGILKKIISEGHSVGNHTFNHLNGWKTETQAYLQNISKCEEILNEVIGTQRPVQEKKLFRPPYGKIKNSQISQLKSDYRIVMWDVLTGDFNINLPEEKCLRKAIKYSKPGSIVIFHDSIKAQKNIRYVLPRYLEDFSSRGYKFKAL